MTKTPALASFMAGLFLLSCSVTQASAQQGTPAPATMLDPKLAPKFSDVLITIPTPEELKTCTVKLVQGTAPKSSGWLLLDGKGNPLRRYFDSNGDGKIDMWSYYKDGVEVYRELDSTFKGLPDNFRWLNNGGMKWGIGGFDTQTKTWRITSWRMISAEEVAVEAFQAVAKNDFGRLQILFLTSAEMEAIKLPAAKVKELVARQQQAADKFAKFVKAANLTDKTVDGVEGGVPHCDTGNGDVEIIKYPSRAVRYPLNAKQYGWIHTGEMIRVGLAGWRIVDVPSTDSVIVPGGGGGAPLVNNDLEKLSTRLAALDEKAMKFPAQRIMDNNAQWEAYYRERIEVIKQIMPLEKDTERENWVKQIFDNLASQAQNTGDKATMGALKKMTDDAIKETPGGALAAYGAYREAWTRYAVGSYQHRSDDKKLAELQDKWLDDLADFVKVYPKAEDSADILQQLATGLELAGKTAAAKQRYEEFFTKHPGHPAAARARGCFARLNLVGRPLELSAPLLNDPATRFDVAKLKGKVVIVHYWASAGSTHLADLAVLKTIVEQFGAKKNVELVCVNLDENAATPRAILAKSQVPGVHLFQSSNNASGLNSVLATQYGIHILPTTFLIGQDGLVTHNGLQVSDIATALRGLEK
jgi:hypothetical protein